MVEKEIPWEFRKIENTKQFGNESCGAVWNTRNNRGGNKFKTALNNESYKDPQFYHNDSIDKVELEKNPNTDKMSFEVLNLGDLGDYGQRSANLETKLKEFCPTVVILAYCHSDQTIKRKDDLIHEALVGAKLLKDTNPPMEIYTDFDVDLKDCPLFFQVSNEEDVEEK